jgi:hypothetical protein
MPLCPARLRSGPPGGGLTSSRSLGGSSARAVAARRFGRARPPCLASWLSRSDLSWAGRARFALCLDRSTGSLCVAIVRSASGARFRFGHPARGAGPAGRPDDRHTGSLLVAISAEAVGRPSFACSWCRGACAEALPTARFCALPPRSRCRGSKTGTAIRVADNAAPSGGAHGWVDAAGARSECLSTAAPRVRGVLPCR